MFTQRENKTFTYDGLAVGDFFCLSTDDKPTEGIANGSELRELDVETNTLTIYYFNAAAENAADKWVPVASVSYGGA